MPSRVRSRRRTTRRLIGRRFERDVFAHRFRPVAPGRGSLWSRSVLENDIIPIYGATGSNISFYIELLYNRHQVRPPYGRARSRDKNTSVGSVAVFRVGGGIPLLDL